MKPPIFFRHRQRSIVFVTLLLFSLLILLVQLWLFVSALEGSLSGRARMVWPGAILSLVCLAANMWMLIGIYRVDHEQ